MPTLARRILEFLGERCRISGKPADWPPDGPVCRSLWTRSRCPTRSALRPHAWVPKRWHSAVQPHRVRGTATARQSADPVHQTDEQMVEKELNRSEEELRHSCPGCRLSAAVLFHPTRLTRERERQCVRAHEARRYSRSSSHPSGSLSSPRRTCSYSSGVTSMITDAW
jgi:hypothetical protein